MKHRISQLTTMIINFGGFLVFAWAIVDEAVRHHWIHLLARVIVGFVLVSALETFITVRTTTRLSAQQNGDLKTELRRLPTGAELVDPASGHVFFAERPRTLLRKSVHIFRHSIISARGALTAVDEGHSASTPYTLYIYRNRRISGRRDEGHFHPATNDQGSTTPAPAPRSSLSELRKLLFELKTGTTRVNSAEITELIGQLRNAENPRT